MAQTSTTNKELFIVETSSPGSRLEIQFVPGVVAGNRNAKLQSVAIVGRNDDLLHYTGGSETLSLELEFYGENDHVLKAVNWLKSLTMNDSYAGAFRTVKLAFGDLFKHEVWAIKSVKPSMTHLAQEAGWLPLRAKVQVEFQLDPKKNRYIDDVRNGR